MVQFSNSIEGFKVPKKKNSLSKKSKKKSQGAMGDEQSTATTNGFPSGYFKIRNRADGRCLDVNGGRGERGTRVILWECHNGLHQQWYADQNGHVKNRENDMCLDLVEQNKLKSSPVQIWDCLNEKSQKWYVDSTGKIRTQADPKLRLMINPGEKDQVSPVYLWPEQDKIEQRWYFERIGDKKNQKKGKKSEKEKKSKKDTKAKKGKGATREGMSIKLTSNKNLEGEYAKTCLPQQAEIKSKLSWCAGTDKPMDSYLQADFGKLHKITEIRVKGRPENDQTKSKNQWVTKFVVHYLVPNSDQWKELNEFKGNVDKDTVNKVKVEVITTSLRIYPTQWNAWPSMRVGFKGKPYQLKGCEKYQNLQKYGKTKKIRQKNKKLFDNKCRKISYAKHRKMLKEEQSAYDELNQKYQDLMESPPQQAIPAQTSVQSQCSSASSGQSYSVQSPALVEGARAFDAEVNSELNEISKDIYRLSKDLQVCQKKFDSNNIMIEGFSDRKQECKQTRRKSRKKDSKKSRKKDSKKDSKKSRKKDSKKSRKKDRKKSQKQDRKKDRKKSQKRDQRALKCSSSNKKFPVVMAKMMLKADCAVPKDELKNYIKRSHARQILAKKLAKMPIEKHPDYHKIEKRSELQDKLIACAQAKLNKIEGRNVLSKKKLEQEKQKSLEQCQKQFRGT
jgi:hypothetical protein